MDQNTFNVYIDEAGDEGFAIKNGQWVSSHWFVVGALVVRSTHDQTVARNINVIKDRLNWERQKPLHFTKLSHEKRKFVIKAITDTGLFRCIYVAMNKPTLGLNTTLKQHPLLYNYCTRFLLERVTWLIDEHNGRANLTFENRSATSYDALREYINNVTNYRGNQIRRDVIQDFHILNKGQSKNLQIADAVTSSLYQALELSSFGMYESSYIDMLKPFIYHRQNNYASYGMKFFPHPFHSPEITTPYKWARNFLE